MRKLPARIFWTILAALFLVEAWLWDLLGGALHALVRALPIEPLRHELKRLVDRLPPAFSLVFFLAPVAVILPFKLVGVALIAKGRLILGGGVFLLAKTAGLGVTAFVFDVCRERLMALGWFARFYARVVAIRDWAHEQVAPYRDAIRVFRRRLAERFSFGSPSVGRRLAFLRAEAGARSRRHF